MAWWDWAVTLWATLASFAVLCLSFALSIRVEENAALRADAAEIMAQLQHLEQGFADDVAQELPEPEELVEPEPVRELPAPRRLRLHWPVGGRRAA